MYYFFWYALNQKVKKRLYVSVCMSVFCISVASSSVLNTKPTLRKFRLVMYFGSKYGCDKFCF